MPHLETPSELAAHIADICGIYSTDENPELRSEFEAEMHDRIFRSVSNFELINQCLPETSESGEDDDR